MNKKPFFITLIVLSLACAAMVSASSSKKTFDKIIEPYEAIRLALLQDSTQEIGERAGEILELAKTSATNEETSEEIRPLLTKISGFATDLAATEDIEGARVAFYEMSKMLVQYRAKVQGDDLPLVMYCPMAKKSWLQLEKEVGNPYHGQSMASCGNDVSN